MTYLLIDVGCTRPKTIQYGNVYTTSNQVGGFAIYTCPDHYTLIGNVLVECLKNGSWSGLQPFCESKF